MIKELPSILIWIEPHPIRHLYDGFTRNIVFLLDALRASYDDKIDLHLTGSEPARLGLLELRPEFSDAFVSFTPQEETTIQGYFKRWDSDALAEWIDIVKGNPGPPRDFYSSVLNRVLDTVNVDLILIWSDNGVVRETAAQRGVPVLSCEFGPTRNNFGDTFYVDPLGTNGYASIRSFPMHLANGHASLPPETWSALASTPLDERAGVLELSRYLPGSGELPKRPYAFVPLQLADDLNTVVHSSYSSPKAFLEHVIPLCREAGLDVVVKGHPGASVGPRPENLIADHAALAYCSDLEGVHVLPRDASPQTTLPVLGNASVVLTINSSIGYEATILGRPVVAFGEAAYDIDGRLRWTEAEGLTERAATDYAAEAAVLWRHYLHPLEPVAGGRSLRTIIELTLDGEMEPLSEAYWQRWMKSIDHARDAVVQGMTSVDPLSLKRSMAAGELVPEQVTGAFRGHIDRVEMPDAGGAAPTLKVSGWVTAKNASWPVQSILVLRRGAALFSTDFLQTRSDIAQKVGAKNPVYRFTLEGPVRDVDPSSLTFGVMSRGGQLEETPLRAGGFGAKSSTHRLDRLERALAEPNKRKAEFSGRVALQTVSDKEGAVRAAIQLTLDSQGPLSNIAVASVFCGGKIIALSLPDQWEKTKHAKHRIRLSASLPSANNVPVSIVLFDDANAYQAYKIAPGPLVSLPATSDDNLTLSASEGSGDSARFEGHIEELSVEPGGIVDELSIRGWLIDPTSLTAPAAVSVLQGGRAVATSTFFELRPDVASRYGLKSIRCGIDMRVPAALELGGNISLAVMSDLQAVETFKLAVGHLGTVSTGKRARSKEGSGVFLRQLKHRLGL